MKKLFRESTRGQISRLLGRSFRQRRSHRGNEAGKLLPRPQTKLEVQHSGATAGVRLERGAKASIPELIIVKEGLRSGAWSRVPQVNGDRGGLASRGEYANYLQSVHQPTHVS
jgi:hypothetical protein